MLLRFAATTVFPPMTLVVLGVLGFLAAVSIGSIAWYNSERPAGWEGRERPKFIPDTTRKKDK
jgi:hypothetical protein